MKFDFLHCALLVAIVLLAVYAFGSFREGYLRGMPVDPVFGPALCKELDIPTEKCRMHAADGYRRRHTTRTHHIRINRRGE